MAECRVAGFGKLSRETRASVTVKKKKEGGELGVWEAENEFGTKHEYISGDFGLYSWGGGRVVADRRVSRVGTFPDRIGASMNFKCKKEDMIVNPRVVISLEQHRLQCPENRE